MNIPTPAQVAANRTARLVAEAKTPTYRSETPAPAEREHLMVIEWESMYGRYWGRPIPESQVNEAVREALADTHYEVSDIDHSAKCWCQR